MNGLEYAGMAVTVFSAYVIFGMAGFGGAMLAVPFLVHFVALSIAVPLMLLLDLLATISIGLRSWRDVARREIAALAPCMVIGVALGATVLSTVKSDMLLLGLGVFVLLNAVWGLFGAARPVQAIGRAWAIPAGTVGGVFSALFGSGGAIYTLFLARRVSDLNQLRATIAATILVSACMRTAAFGAAGLLQQAGLWHLGLVLAPCCFIGVLVGTRMHSRLPATIVRRLIFGLLTIGGIGAILRGLGH